MLTCAVLSQMVCYLRVHDSVADASSEGRSCSTDCLLPRDSRFRLQDFRDYGLWGFHDSVADASSEAWSCLPVCLFPRDSSFRVLGLRV
eukprot:943967-Pyramimonas_sp.AAC.2